MDTLHSLRILGLMSGSSLDGINAAVISTDGVDIFDFGPILDVPYEDELREKLRWLHRNYKDASDMEKQAIEEELTKFHADVVKDIIENYDEKIDLIGFHGHTIFHNANDGTIYQIGNAKQLAELTGIKTVGHFRQADILSGGLGAPLAAVYHQALSSQIEKPTVFVDIGGIATLTWIGANGELMAFDTGPGNNAINDWVFKHAGQHMDYNGKLAAIGKVNEQVLKQLTHHKFLAKVPPRAADKNTFADKLEHLEGLSLEDGAATATAFVAEAIAYSSALYLPEQPKIMVVCGGGALNPTLLRFIRQRLPEIEVKSSLEYGWNPSAIEAQAFAYLAARRINLMPSSYPFTTGVYEPCICGEVFEA